MTQSLTTTTSSTSDVRESLEIIEVKPGVRFSVNTLRSFLPDVETLLFFCKVYDLDYKQVSNLLLRVLRTDVAVALFGEGHEHSSDLQGYLVEGYEDEDGNWHDPIVPAAQRGQIVTDAAVPHGEILPHVWKSMEVEVATSIKAVAEKLEGVVARMPGKQGEMVFRSMMTMNAKRPTLGDFRAKIHHPRQRENLVIMDVSGSMSQGTVRRIVNDVVAMSYQANAHFAVVSNTTTHWDPGAYDADAVLNASEFGGTHYETLADLLKRDWGTVVTVADYDSSADAKRYLRDNCSGHIEQLLDVSLVNRPTYLAECVGQFAGEVRPILIANSSYVLS